MKRVSKFLARGFTLVEVLISGTISTLVLGALLVGGISLQKNFQATEIFLQNQTGSNRLIDYLDLDLKCATSVTFNGSTFREGERKLGKGDILEIRRPRFYRSNDRADPDYNQEITLAATVDAGGNLGVDYGPGSTEETIITYTYAFDSVTGAMCYRRSENGAADIIVDRADSFDCDLIMRDGGRRVEVQVWFISPYGEGTAQINSSGLIMIRNTRQDL